MSKENFRVTAKEDGKEYWISRALTVVGCIFTITKERELRFLFEIRGKGCPDNVGKLAFPCGYLNWDETLEQALRREIYEETGLSLDKSDIFQWKIIDDPTKDARQNVSVRFAVYCRDLEEQLPNLLEAIKSSESRGGESEEVADLMLLGIDDINKISDDDFAFNHKQVVAEFMEELKETVTEPDTESMPGYSRTMD